MAMIITVQDLALFILFIVAVTLGIYLIITLRNANKTITRAKTIIEKNEKNMEKALSYLPEIARDTSFITKNLKESVEEVNAKVPHVINNVNDITEDVKGSVKAVNATVGIMGESISETVTAVKDTSEGITTYIAGIKEIIDVLRHLFSKSK